jgi:hypothetical protein
VLRRALLPLLLAACGPDSSDVTGESSTTSTTDASTTDAPTSASGPATGTSGAAPTVTTDEPDPGTSTTTGPGDPSTGPIDPTTGADPTTGTSTGDDTSSGIGTDTGDPEVEYAAFFFSGGLNHVMIHRADVTNDRCTTLHLAWPGGMMPDLAITAPDDYAAQNAQISEGVVDCLAGMPMGEAVPAVAGSGAVKWMKGPMEFCPLQLDIDVTLDFAQDLPWVPAQEQLQATAIPVQNCP